MGQWSLATIPSHELDHPAIQGSAPFEGPFSPRDQDALRSLDLASAQAGLNLEVPGGQQVDILRSFP